jgi:hypothetical protein
MEPFETIREAMDWIMKNAAGPVEVLIWNKKWMFGGKPWDGVEVPPTSCTEPGWCFW